jgi:hypothetical protein
MAAGVLFLLSKGVRQALKPLAVAAATGTAQLGQELRAAAAKAKEDMADIVAEAQFETFKASAAGKARGATPETGSTAPDRATQG